MICVGGWSRLKQIYDLIGSAQILAQGTFFMPVALVIHSRLTHEIEDSVYF